MDEVTNKSKGRVLRALGGCRVRVITTRQDWETRRIGQGDHAGYAVGNALVAFEADSYREFEAGSDMWDFIVEEGAARFHVYLSGEDIFMLYVPSEIA